MINERERKQICGAIKFLLTEFVKDVEFDVVCPHFFMFSCTCPRNADLSLLKEFGIELRNGKHWDRDSVCYSFTINGEIFQRIANYSEQVA